MDRRLFLAGIAMSAVGLGAGRAGAEPDVELRIEDEDLYARCGDRPVLRYRRRIVEPPEGVDPLLAANGYIHPFQTPNGAVVTNHLSPDHRHQRGVFFAWTKTEVTLNGETLHPDFWNIQSGTGRVRSLGVEVLTGAAEPGFRAKHVSEAKVGEKWEGVLDETWEVRFPSQGARDPDGPTGTYLFDLTSRQVPRCPVLLPKYHYGGMAVRGSGQWAKGSDMVVLTSEGKDRAAADAAPARWIDMSGSVGGRQAGVALLEHPSNLHAPNAVRMHPDMPYYVFAVPQAGPVRLDAGKEYVFRYRVVAHNGRGDRERLDALWRQFTERA